MAQLETHPYSQGQQAIGQRGYDPRAHGAPQAHQTGGGAGQQVGFFVQIMGGVVSLALIAGVGVWGYQLLARDVSGVPVVQALDGPMRVAPADPGGEQAAHQGLSVNDVAALGTAAPPRDRLTLAPEPEDLAEGDLPMARLTPVAAANSSASALDAFIADAGEETLEMAALLMGEVLVPELNLQDVAEVVATSAPVLASAPGDVSAAAPATAEEAAVPLLAAADLPKIEGGVSISKRPRVRPDAIVAETVAAVVAGPVTPGLDLVASELTPGTRLVQLGAFDSEEVARSEWNRISGQFGNYMEGKRRVIQKASKAGRSFYRLRAHGFTDLADARRFCSALVAEKAACIPVLVK